MLTRVISSSSGPSSARGSGSNRTENAVRLRKEVQSAGGQRTDVASDQNWLSRWRSLAETADKPDRSTRNLYAAWKER